MRLCRKCGCYERFAGLTDICCRVVDGRDCEFEDAGSAAAKDFGLSLQYRQDHPAVTSSQPPPQLPPPQRGPTQPASSEDKVARAKAHRKAKTVVHSVRTSLCQKTVSAISPRSPRSLRNKIATEADRGAAPDAAFHQQRSFSVSGPAPVKNELPSSWRN